jgi:hypothetical protein
MIWLKLTSNSLKALQLNACASHFIAKYNSLYRLLSVTCQIILIEIDQFINVYVDSVVRTQCLLAKDRYSKDLCL